MFEKFTEKAVNVIVEAQNIAIYDHSDKVLAEHLLLALVKEFVIGRDNGRRHRLSLSLWSASGRRIGDAQELSFFKLLCAEFGIGRNQFGFRYTI